MAEANVLTMVQTPLVCEFCQSFHIENDVTSYCNDCKASICCKCQNDHLEGKPYPMFKRHTIVPRVEALQFRLSEDEPCSIHAGCNYILHCNNCHQLVCNHCIIEEHNGHDFCKIDVAMETVCQDLKQYSDTINTTLLGECIAMESTISENGERCEDFYATKEHDVQKKREKLTSEVNRLCDDVLQTIATEKKKSMSIIDQEKMSIQDKIQGIKMLLDTKKDAMKRSELIKLMKQKSTLADFKLPHVSQLQLPTWIDEQLEGLQVVQSYNATDDSKTPHTRDNEVLHNTKSTTDDNQVKQSITTDDNQVKQSMTTDANQVKQSMTTNDNQVKKSMVTNVNQVKQSMPTYVNQVKQLMTNENNQVKQSMTKDDNQIKQSMVTDGNQVKQSMITDDKNNKQVPQSAGIIDVNQVKQSLTIVDNKEKQSMTTNVNQIKESMTADDKDIKQVPQSAGMIDVSQEKQTMTTDVNHVKQSMTPDDNQVKQSMTTDDNQVKQSITTEDKDNKQVPQSADTGMTDVQLVSRHQYDTQACSIVSIDDDRIWFSGYKSNKLMLVNTKGQTLKQITTKLPIASFTIVPSRDIITSHFGGKCLQLMSETGQVTTTINTYPDKPSGVCLTNDRKHIAVCLYSPDLTSKLAVFGLDGQRKETFQYTEKKLSNFSSQQVTTNQSGDYCVAHNGLHVVFVISKSGTLKFTYDGSNATPKTGSFWPFDIACDKYSNLLISDYTNNAVHMVDQQGKFLKYQLTSEHGVVNPKGLSLNKGGKLWVGMEDGTLLVVKYLK